MTNEGRESHARRCTHISLAASGAGEFNRAVLPSPRLHSVRLSVFAVLCSVAISATAATGVQRSVFGTTPEGATVEAFTLTNARGASAKIITFGAILADLRVPDREGKMASVVREITASEQGFQRGFRESGAIFGRVANRIAGGQFTLDGKTINVTKNSGPHHIHGGTKNFSRVLWQPTVPANGKAPSVELTYTAADGEEGFPGKLTLSVTYTLTAESTLRLDYRATTDQPTPLNPTNHAYFNLAAAGDVLDHEVTISADRYTVSDSALIPTGEIKPVAGSALDFTRPSLLAARVAQLPASRRYDNNFIINRRDGDATIAFAARVRDPRSGRTMEVWTTEPAVQLYTSPLGTPDAKEASPRFGFYCFETQHYPDSVNHTNFPSTILRPGQTFRSTTEYRFSAGK